jgi:flagellar biosynthesis/type III secretory pathway protein FliH
LVAGAGLNAAEIQVYPEFDDAGDPRSPSGGDAGSSYRAVEFESIDIFEFAPWIVLSAAQEKAAESIAQAQAEAEAIRAEARNQGGVEGREAMARDLAPTLIAFANAGQALIILEEQLVSRYAPRIVQLALEIAEKVIGRAVEVDGRIAESVLERAKQEVAHARQIRLCLNPEDRKFLAETRPDLVRAEGASGRTIEIVDAPEMGRGGCRLETESGMVDATLPTQLDEIRRQLLDDDRPEN